MTTASSNSINLLRSKRALHSWGDCWPPPCSLTYWNTSLQARPSSRTKHNFSRPNALFYVLNTTLTYFTNSWQMLSERTKQPSLGTTFLLLQPPKAAACHSRKESSSFWGEEKQPAASPRSSWLLVWLPGALQQFRVPIPKHQDDSQLLQEAAIGDPTKILAHKESETVLQPSYRNTPNTVISTTEITGRELKLSSRNQSWISHTSCVVLVCSHEANAESWVPQLTAAFCTRTALHPHSACVHWGCHATIAFAHPKLPKLEARVKWKKLPGGTSNKPLRGNITSALQVWVNSSSSHILSHRILLISP